MDRKERFELEARLTAIEFLVQRMYQAQLAQAPEGTIDLVIANWWQGSETQTIPNLDPAQSDLAAQEIREHIDRILRGVKELLEQGKA